jgi:hypothetical protein
VARLVKDRLWGVWGRFYSGVSGRERSQGSDEEDGEQGVDGGWEDGGR